MTAPDRKALTPWLLSGLLLVIFALGVSKTLDYSAQQPLDNAFQRALITFGVVRGINAVVSVVQGTEVAIEPAGIGVILTPGEIFDPVNDLIERFSWIVLAASTSLGAQKILVSIGSALFAQILLTAAVVFLLVSIWKPSVLPDRWRSTIVRASIVFLFLRFLVPITVITNDIVYQSFLGDRYEQSYTVLEKVGEDVKALQDNENAALAADVDSGLLDSISRWYDRTTQSINVQARLKEYESRLANASEQIIDLIVVFILQTLVFPILFFWIGLKFIRAVVSTGFWQSD